MTQEKLNERMTQINIPDGISRSSYNSFKEKVKKQKKNFLPTLAEVIEKALEDYIKKGEK